jgi:hypothetical protein
VLGGSVLACDGRPASLQTSGGATLSHQNGPPSEAESPEELELNPRFGRAAEGVAAFGAADGSADFDVVDAAAPIADFPGDEVDLDSRVVERNAIPEAATTLTRLQRGHGPLTGAAPTGRFRSASAAAEPSAKTWKRSQIVPNTSRLRVGDNEELPLDGVEASVRIDGTRARVVLDCLFRNDRDRNLEGTFDLRLPNEATPFWFAFGECVRADKTETVPGPANVQAMFLGAAAATADATSIGGLATARERTWTKPKEARVVPRERAAWAYAEATRRRVDPALVEWTGADFFSARVVPLAPGATHRIVVAYDMDLVPSGDDFEYRLDLPQDIPQRSVTVTVRGADAVTLTPPAERKQSADGSTWTLRNPSESAVVVRLAKPGATLLQGRDDAAGPCFAITLRPELAAADSTAQPSRGVFMVDTSLSSGPERFPVWLKLVRQILDRNRASLREFAVLYFDVQARWWRRGFVPNTPENVEAFLADAEKLSLEGATDLCGALAEAASPAWRPAGDRAARHDLFLLSDGAATWGAADRTALDAALARGAGGAVWAYQTGLTGTDSATLAHLARTTGGAVFSVTGDAEVEAASTAHALRPYLLRGVSVAGGSDLLVAGRPTAVHPGQTLRIAGRGAVADGTRVVLRLERDGRPFEVASVPARVVRSDLAVRAYGQIAVGQIEEWGDVKDSPARAYATHFRVVGSTCSLLMLESEEDYERYGIKPEDDAARVRAELASDFVAKAEADRRSAAATPRSDLLAWLRRLETTPGMEFHLPAGFTDVLGKMPDDAFRADVPALDCRLVRLSDVPGAMQEILAARTFDYDAVESEAKRRLSAAGGADALRAFSSLVENRPGDTALARDAAFQALQWKLPEQAVHLLRRVARMRPYEPETYRVLADTFGQAGKGDQAILWSEVALAGNFDARFGDFRAIATGDYVRLLRRISRGEVRTSVREYAAQRLAALESSGAKDEPSLVVVLSWNTDRTDVDLHVIEPTGEECYYQHTSTRIGGNITADVTQGFGPEMYRVARPAAGDYRVRVNYYASDRSRASVRSQVHVTIYENWGRPDERVTRRVVTLKEGGEQTEEVATVRIAQ